MGLPANTLIASPGGFGSSQMDFSDLFVVVAVISGLYALIIAIARQKHFLTQAVNPYRRSWLIAGFSLMWVGIGLLRLEAHSWNIAEWRPIIGALVTDKPMSIQAKMATVAIFGGLSFLLVLLWCRLSLPRDPSTFCKPEDRSRAFHYYISKLHTGLDYAVLMRNGGEILEEAWCEAEILRRLEFLPRLECAAGVKRVRSLPDQLAAWRATAISIHKTMDTLDGITGPAKQGPNMRMVFDVEYGGLFFICLQLPDSREKNPDHYYLFAATLNQTEMNNKTADRHFAMLVQSLRNIEDSIRMM